MSSSATEGKQLAPINQNSEQLGQVKQQGQVADEEQMEQQQHVVQHEQWASDDHDGLSERHTAALLLLVLGTFLTAALGAIAGCRLRASRRRRHHKRYALDSDYLVNGMYL